MSGDGWGNCIIINDADKKTSLELDIELLKRIEKAANTGPIIGEAREMILTLSRNLRAMSMMLDVFKFDIKMREDFFRKFCEVEKERDKKILAERAKNDRIN